MKIFDVYAIVDDHIFEQYVGYVRADTRLEAYEVANQLFENVIYLSYGKDVESY